MEEVGKLEMLMVPDSYQSDEEYADLNSKAPSLFQWSIRRNNVDVDNYMINNDNENKVDVDVDVDVDEGDEEAKEVDLEEKNEELYMVWFDAFLAKHGFDKDYLDQSSLQQIHKTWLQKKLTSAHFRFKEAEIDLKFINFRYAICKRWLSSL